MLFHALLLEQHIFRDLFPLDSLFIAYGFTNTT